VAEFLLLGCATLVLLVAARPYSAAIADVAVALAAVALGFRNAAVRSLAVPDLTTTVLTMTLTGVAADLRKRDFLVASRRILAVVAMLVGAVSGALIVRNGSGGVALAIACALVGGVFVAVALASRRDARWQHR
jgi:hypothetical protein